MALLSEQEREEALRALPQWRYDAVARALRRSLKFADFGEAFAFMTRVAMEAEKMDHHPEWSNVWNRVDVALTTHTARGVTALDVTLAGAIDRFAAGIG